MTNRRFVLRLAVATTAALAGPVAVRRTATAAPTVRPSATHRACSLIVVGAEANDDRSSTSGLAITPTADGGGTVDLLRRRGPTLVAPSVVVSPVTADAAGAASLDRLLAAVDATQGAA